MPIVKKNTFKGWRPNCRICGRFIGEGGYYSVCEDMWYGGFEEDEALCKYHYEKLYGEKKCQEEQDVVVDTIE